MNVVSENVKTFWWCFNRPFDPLETHRVALLLCEAFQFKHTYVYIFKFILN